MLQVLHQLVRRRAARRPAAPSRQPRRRNRRGSAARLGSRARGREGARGEDGTWRGRHTRHDQMEHLQTQVLKEAIDNLAQATEAVRSPLVSWLERQLTRGIWATVDHPKIIPIRRTDDENVHRPSEVRTPKMTDST